MSHSNPLWRTTNKVIHYMAANGHLMAWYEDANQLGKPGRECAWRAWHSEKCNCDNEPIPNW